MRCVKDKYGTKLKYPTRSCKECGKYPCFDGIEKCRSDFASMGCIMYVRSKDKNVTALNV